MTESIFGRALEALLSACPDEKVSLTQALSEDWLAGRLAIVSDDLPRPVAEAGRPEVPLLVPAQDVPRRRVGSRDGHAALLHAIAHIEFNAINLALDCVFRFRGLPEDFYAGWVRVAAEEAYHFGLIRARLRALGYEYGSFPAHNGLWEMTVKTAHDPLARMALVPRVLEARGLDATPLIMDKLRSIGDVESVAVLEIILRDEVGHVALGDFWFRHFCGQAGLEPESAYLALIEQFAAPWPNPPLHVEARLEAGFSAVEIARLSRPR